LNTPLVSIIDDDESVRKAIRNLIRSLGYAAETFASAEEYLESELLRVTACLITDLHMPGLDGASLQGRLVSEGYSTPIIFVTAYSDEKTRTHLLEAGAVGFFSKPFDENGLVTCLDRALKG